MSRVGGFSKPEWGRDHVVPPSGGFTLIELMLVILFIGIMGVTISSVFNTVASTTLRSREQTVAANLSQKFFVRLNSIPYPYVFACNSSSASFGLTGTYGPTSAQVSPYPYLGVFSDFYRAMQSHKFDQFTLDVRFMIRDLGDLDGDQETTDLRAFVDANGDGIDDYDPALRYADQNGDGDYRDTYGSPEVTEEPHTRLKEATLKLYKGGRLILEETQLISWEKFTGVEGKAAGASLPLIVSTPSENSAVYDLTTAARQNAFNLPLSTTYPEEVRSFRGDSVAPLRMMGETTAGATFSWKLDYSSNATLDTCTADYLGGFDCSVTNITAALTEGQHVIWGQSYKSAYYSPWTPTTLIRDINPPAIQNAEPAGTVVNLRPTVRAQFLDQPVTAGRSVSGLNTSVMRLFRGTAAVSFDYEAISGYVTYVDSITNLPPLLSTGAYTFVLEGGDNAKYHARSTWSFTIDLGDWTDHSAPTVEQKTPSGFSASNPPVVYCDVKDNQSGINIETIVLKLDGNVVVSSACGNLFTATTPLSPQDGYRVTYTPSAALSPGWHSVTAVGSHWATFPADKITTEESWQFNVP